MDEEFMSPRGPIWPLGSCRYGMHELRDNDCRLLESST